MWGDEVSLPYSCISVPVPEFDCLCYVFSWGAFAVAGEAVDGEFIKFHGVYAFCFVTTAEGAASDVVGD